MSDEIPTTLWGRLLEMGVKTHGPILLFASWMAYELHLYLQQTAMATAMTVQILCQLVEMHGGNCATALAEARSMVAK